MGQSMKTIKFVLLFIAAFSLGFCFISCKNKASDDQMNQTVYNEQMPNDSIPLEEALTKQYDIDVLRNFFKNSNINEGQLNGESPKNLSFQEVNQAFPIEVIRTEGYSVYSVTEGGYYYVFWVDSFTEDANQSEQYVYFSAYLNSNSSSTLFDSIQPGNSTAKDVKELDPSVEMNLLQSSGVYSYSYINDEILVEVEYECQNGLSKYEDMLVKKVNIVGRNSVPSRYRAIQLQDIPTYEKTGDGSLS